jgi:hypothetical protein
VKVSPDDVVCLRFGEAFVSHETPLGDTCYFVSASRKREQSKRNFSLRQGDSGIVWAGNCLLDSRGEPVN